MCDKNGCDGIFSSSTYKILHFLFYVAVFRLNHLNALKFRLTVPVLLKKKSGKRK